MRKLIAAIAVALGAVLLSPTLALAADTDLENSETTTFELSPLAVSVILGTLLPIITGLLTKLNARDWVKGLVNLVLSAVAGVITANLVVGGGAVVSDETLILAGISFVTSVASYFGFYQNVNLNAKLAPNSGLS
jgi:hypothetical protein